LSTAAFVFLTPEIERIVRACAGSSRETRSKRESGNCAFERWQGLAQDVDGWPVNVGFPSLFLMELSSAICLGRRG
jgi:hypothetical protein